MNSLYLSIPFLFLEFSSFSGRLKARKYEFPFKCQHCDDFFLSFFNFFYLRKGFLVFMNALLVFCLYLLRSWMLNGMLVFGLMAFFSERWLWMSMMVCFCEDFACTVDEVEKICIFGINQIRTLILKNSELVRKRRVDRIPFSFIKNLTLRVGEILLLILVAKLKRMAKWSDERSLFMEGL